MQKLTEEQSINIKRAACHENYEIIIAFRENEAPNQPTLGELVACIGYCRTDGRK